MSQGPLLTPKYMTFYILNSFLAGLSEALGINELSTALDALRGAVESSLKGNGVAGTRSKAELLNANNRLTEEVTQLRQQLQELEARKVDAIAQLKDEVSFFFNERFPIYLNSCHIIFSPTKNRNCRCSNSCLSKGDTTARIRTSCIRLPLWRIHCDKNERGKSEH